MDEHHYIQEIVEQQWRRRIHEHLKALEGKDPQFLLQADQTGLALSEPSQEAEIWSMDSLHMEIVQSSTWNPR